jgi:Fe-Mn family superoxide dismutase
MAVRGWVVLAYSLYDGKLHNYGADAHHFNFPALAWPLLVLDVYEHAYTIDYGVKRPPYLDVFMKNIRWDVVNKRLERVSKLG